MRNRSLAAEPKGPKWHRHFVYRKESLRTTWKLRLSILLLGILGIAVTRGVWAPRVGESLVCKEQIAQGAALLVENFDQDYLPFERAAELQKAGVADRILVPTLSLGDTGIPGAASKGVVEVFARVAGARNIEIIPIQEIEPISLNAAKQVREFLTQQQLASVVVVTPAFRSRRTSLVYDAVLTPAKITFHCAPVVGTLTSGNWTKTWHGIQEVALQFAKLQYYRFYVLR